MTEVRRVLSFLLTNEIVGHYLSQLDAAAAACDAFGRKTRSSTTEAPERRDRFFGMADGLRTFRKMIERDHKLTEEHLKSHE